MALIVEDGTNVAGADSYVTLADANTYWTDFGSPAAWNDAATAQRESALRHATRWIDERYSGRWKGTVKYSTQELRWPRIGVVDDEGRTIGETEIPRVLKEAVYQLAHLHLDGAGLSATATGGARRQKVGDLEVEYFSSSGEREANRLADALIGGLLTTSPGVLMMQRG